MKYKLDLILLGQDKKTLEGEGIDNLISDLEKETGTTKSRSNLELCLENGRAKSIRFYPFELNRLRSNKIFRNIFKKRIQILTGE